MTTVITADNGGVSGTAGLKQSADSSGILALATGTGTTAVTIDASQNVGIGRSPNYQLDVYRSGTTNATVASANDNVVNILQVSGNTAGVVGTLTSHPLVFTAGNTERMRIETSGNLLVNSTSAAASEKLGVYTTGAGAVNVFLRNSNTSASGTYFLWGQANGADKILWNTTGSVAIAAGQTYGNISDRKYKTNIVDTTPKLADVMRLKVRNFSTLSDPDTKYVGWIAQEFQEVFPSLVFEFESKSEGDATETSLGVKESALTPILVKAIQEQQALITTLTERITALEAK